MDFTSAILLRSFARFDLCPCWMWYIYITIYIYNLYLTPLQLWSIMSPAPAAWVKKGSPQMPNLMNNLGSWWWRFFIFQRLKDGSDFAVSLVWSSMLGGRWPWWHFMMKPCISGMVSMSPGLGLLNYWLACWACALTRKWLELLT